MASRLHINRTVISLRLKPARVTHVNHSNRSQFDPEVQTAFSAECRGVMISSTAVCESPHAIATSLGKLLAVDLGLAFG